MSRVGSGEAKVVWTPPASGPNSQNIWAPELHFLDGKWYLYYTAGSSGDLGTQRSFVLENPSPDPLQGTWTDKGRIYHPTEDFWAIDASVFEHNAKRYLIWWGIAAPATLRNKFISAKWQIRGRSPGRVCCFLRPNLPGKPLARGGTSGGERRT